MDDPVDSFKSNEGMNLIHRTIQNNINKWNVSTDAWKEMNRNYPTLYNVYILECIYRIYSKIK